MVIFGLLLLLAASLIIIVLTAIATDYWLPLPKRVPFNVTVAVAVALIAAGIVIFVEAHDHTREKWLDWSECVDGETAIGNVTINDCDDYYNLPEREDED